MLSGVTICNLCGMVGLLGAFFASEVKAGTEGPVIELSDLDPTIFINMRVVDGLKRLRSRPIAPNGREVLRAST
jgi:hypothetical protein